MKKILCFAIAVLMLALMASSTVISASADVLYPQSYASLYSGVDKSNVDTSWYYNNLNASEYHITSADMLYSLSVLVTDDFVNFEGKTVYLDCDIVWNDGVFSMDTVTFAPLYDNKPISSSNPVFEWYPIGDRLKGYSTNPDETGSFLGSFDGQGHTISGLYVNDNLPYAGLFGIFCGRELKNLNIVNSYFGGQMCNGSFAGFAMNIEFYGANRDVVGALYENLYSNAYVVTKGQNGNGMDSRSGGIFGMIRNSNASRVINVRKSGSLWKMNHVWFDGTLAATKTTFYSGGLIGFAAMDEQTFIGTGLEEEFHKLIIEDCLMTGAIYNCTEIATSAPEKAIRLGLIIGNFYNGTLEMKNVIAAPKDTNIRENYVDASGNGFLPETLGKGIIGRFENKNFGNITFENVFVLPIGYFTANNWVILNAPDSEAVLSGAIEYIVQGAPVFDNGLKEAAIKLSENTAFDLSIAESPKLTGFDTTVDEINPDDILPSPGPYVEETTKAPEDTSKVPYVTTLTEYLTELPYVTAAPNHFTTPGADHFTTTDPVFVYTDVENLLPGQAVEYPANKNGSDDVVTVDFDCDSFSLFASFIALAAITGAAIVIKKN